jgi:predicted site-specific integrase-resolvase
VNIDELPELVSRDETRKVLRISESTLQRHFDKGLLNRVRIGGRVFVRRDDIEALMKPADHLQKVRCARRVEVRCSLKRGR